MPSSAKCSDSWSLAVGCVVFAVSHVQVEAKDDFIARQMKMKQSALIVVKGKNDKIASPR